MRKIVHLVVGARPNFMKMAPLYHALRKETWANPVFVHTGQHSSPMMSDAFIRDLRLPPPDHHLNATGAGHAQITASVMVAYEKLLLEQRPDCIVVPGDVNSTLAACITAKKLNIDVVHLEAGLRSMDRTMPEEQNRIAVDALSDLLWTPSKDANENLAREGIPPERMDLVGNLMIDAYEMMRAPIAAAGAAAKRGLSPGGYGVVTLHRPSNVDSPEALRGLARALAALSKKIELVFPIHPRTARALEAAGIHNEMKAGRIHMIDPLGYVEFMSLVETAALVVTDSGGLQEEAAYIGAPCLTLRSTTERPITLNHGNRLTTPEALEADARDALERGARKAAIEFWDGKAAMRATSSLKRFLT